MCELALPTGRYAWELAERPLDGIMCALMPVSKAANATGDLIALSQTVLAGMVEVDPLM